MTSYSERLQANSGKVNAFMENHGEYLENMKGITGTVMRLLHSVFKNNVQEQEKDVNNKWTISAVMTKVMDAVSPEGKGIFGFFKKDQQPQKDPFDLPGLQSMPAPKSTADILNELNITSNDISNIGHTPASNSIANILEELNITSNDISNVTAKEIMDSLNISSNPIVAQIGEDWNREIGTPRFSQEDEINRRVQRTSMQSGMDAPLNL